jgi:hypothetical protein
MPNPYHVRRAISQYGDRFRAELFSVVVTLELGRHRPGSPRTVSVPKASPAASL